MTEARAETFARHALPLASTYDDRECRRTPHERGAPDTLGGARMLRFRRRKGRRSGVMLLNAR